MKQNDCNHHHGHHHHHHEVSDLKSVNVAFYIGILLNLVFTAVEFYYGYTKNSLALLADAAHNLSDVASLVISLIGLRLIQKAATKLFTYGYKKASILASLINAILLLFVVFHIVKEAIERFDNQQQIGGEYIVITALVGVVINSLSAYLFHKGQKQDINIRGAFLHLLVDALVSVGVLVSGIIIYYTNWYIIDPIVSIIIAIFIVFSTWKLLKESIKLTLDGVPEDVDTHKIENIFKNNEYVKNIHHLHIWAISTKTNALTAHIVLAEEDFKSSIITELKKYLKHELLHHNIQHTTLEFEVEDYDCGEVNCR